MSTIPGCGGEIRWPTDGDHNANTPNVQNFNQGLFDRIVTGKGTLRRPQMPDLSNFENHWGSRGE
jgi:hypothetical protein